MLYMNAVTRRFLKQLIPYWLCFYSGSVQADHFKQLPDLTVPGQHTGFDSYVIYPYLVNAPAADSAQLLKKIPGANVNSNGTVTGIAQYRGMYGDRVNILVDGIKISPGGPNAMDAPLSYIPSVRLNSLEVVRGIAPVSSGNETIGGTIRAISTHSSFTSGEQIESHGQASVAGHSVDNGYDISTLMSLANQNHRMYVSASRQDGNDYEFADGNVTPGEHDRNSYETGYGYRQGGHEFSLEYVRNDSNENGTPALPMDIIFVDADIVRGTYKGQWDQVDIDSKVYWTQVDHKMSNFELRQAPLTGGGPMTMQRFSLADSEDYGYGINANMDFAGGKLKLGTDGHLAEHNADVLNPMDGSSLIQNYNNIQRDVFGIFGEWERKLVPAWNLQLGLRYTHVSMDASTVTAAGFPMPMLQMNANTLAAAFNAADQSIEDNNIDAAIKLVYSLSEDTDIEIGFARKTRSPSYQERYLWLPLQSTGGLADGNNYIGDINLNPEVSYQLELGLDWRSNNAYLAPRGFYHYVDDYIQGADTTSMTAIMFNTMVTTMLGSRSRILQFSNIDARLYGIDVDFGYHVNLAWHIDGAINYLKGERRDNDDNLYRISPVNARLGLTHQHSNWSATIETVAYLEKDDVSAITNELETAGYALLNIFGNYMVPGSGVTLVTGIDNLLDKEYSPHLNGVNRVRNVDVPVGVRIPGPGINAYANLIFEW